MDIFHILSKKRKVKKKSKKSDKKQQEVLQTKGLSFGMTRNKPVWDGMTILTEPLSKISVGAEAHNNTYHGVGLIRSEREVTGQLRCLL